LTQDLIDAELYAAIGAEPHERTDARTNQRNGSRARALQHPSRPAEASQFRCHPHPRQTRIRRCLKRYIARQLYQQLQTRP